MKNISLTVKIWLALSLISLLLYLIVVLIMPYLIRNFFSSTLMESHAPPPEKNIIKETLPSFVNVRGFNIKGFTILEGGITIPSEARRLFPDTLFNEIQLNAISQQSHREHYESTNGQVRIRYVIKKEFAYGKPLYQITFLRKSEEDRFVKTLLFNIIVLAGIALIVSWFASLFIARYLTRPLIQMGQHVKRIANRNWYDPLNIKRGDEIGELANSIETMRQQLVQQDESQQAMLQNISHELKTPVMVIRSYAQAINDGIFPRGDLAGSINVIDEEGERLEKLIKQLLYLNRLDYLSAQNSVKEEIKLDRLIEKVVQRMSLQRSEISWCLDLQPVTIKGDEDTLRTMIENLVDNHLRHAISCVEINLIIDREKTESVLYFWNDGSKVESHILNELAQPFQKGRGGKFGLGIVIVQRILQIYQGQISLKNEKGGVSTTVKIPLH